MSKPSHFEREDLIPFLIHAEDDSKEEELQRRSRGAPKQRGAEGRGRADAGQSAKPQAVWPRAAAISSHSSEGRLPLRIPLENGLMLLSLGSGLVSQ